MEIRLLNRAETEKVYREQMTRDFPQDELKPFAMVEQHLRDGIYEPLGFFEGDRLVAYAFQTILPDARNALLDYFAVLPQYRGTGVGSRGLAMLAQHYAGRLDSLIIECEHPLEAPEPKTARRRIGFYLRAGARAVAMETRLYGVRYQIYALPCGGQPTDFAIHEDINYIYKKMQMTPYFQAKVLFYGE